MAVSLSPISSIAWSQEMRCHWPPDSFIGYLRRRSLCTISRIAAPLAQCVPRLIGLSQDGSWPTQTPFCTSAVTVQPTEQWVQMFLRTTVGWPATRGPASARRTVPSCNEPTAASAPVVSPAFCRKLRRSVSGAAPPPDTAGSLARPTSPLLRLISIAPSLLQRLVAVGPVIGLDVVGLAVSRLGLFSAGIVRFGRARQHGGRDRGGRRDARSPQEIAAVDGARLGLVSHSSLHRGGRNCHSIVKASASISI